MKACLQAGAAALLWAAVLLANPQTVRLKLSAGGRIVEVPLEPYVAAVLAAESNNFHSPEALKAMAVAARTYAVRMHGRHGAEGFDLCDTTHCQRADQRAVTARLETAGRDTTGEIVWHQAKPAFTPFSQDCGGASEDAAGVWPDMAAPYLRSHPDAWCARDARWQWNAAAEQIARALQSSALRAPPGLRRIGILNPTPSGRAATLLMSGAGSSVRISASSFRFAVGRELGWNTLRSDAYEIRMADSRVLFEGSGAGHGVGLCQHGAEAMGRAGSSYREILAAYFPGTSIGVNATALEWQVLQGEAISLFTMRPAEDRIALATAEKVARSIAARTGWPIPHGLGIRVYPDLDTFRNATGEPGWVAAHTLGVRIELQPVRILESRGALHSTLLHELLHAMMHGVEAPGLPLWFQEGLPAYLEHAPSQGAAVAPADAELRQTADANRARQAYAQGNAMVTSLVRRYGESAVLDWVRRGVPAEVTKASSSQPAPKSK